MYKVLIIVVLFFIGCENDCYNGRHSASDGAKYCLSLAKNLGVEKITLKHKKFAINCCNLVTSAGGHGTHRAHSCTLRLIIWEE